MLLMSQPQCFCGEHQGSATTHPPQVGADGASLQSDEELEMLYVNEVCSANPVGSFPSPSLSCLGVVFRNFQGNGPFMPDVFHEVPLDPYCRWTLFQPQLLFFSRF